MILEIPKTTNLTKSCRIRCTQTTSSWAWDVRQVSFFSGNILLKPTSLECSASASDGEGPPGYEASRAISADERVWGGRKDSDGVFWLAAVFDNPVLVTVVKIVEKAKHRSKNAQVELLNRSNWVEAKGVCISISLENYKPTDLEEKRPVDFESKGSEEYKLSDFFVEPSQSISGRLHGCCYKKNVHPVRKVPFAPDANFYYSQNCEGLWVCVSKACGVETLSKACSLIRYVIPLDQRKLWGMFRSTKGRKDPGPMRVVVLDNRTNQQAGIIPELQDDSPGRNGTASPFVFTSREDFFGGIAGVWAEGRLTLHEMTHGADMVIRQLVDPYFHNEVENLYAKHKQKFRYLKADEDWKYCYAGANRDEFLAEVHTIAQGMHLKSEDYQQCKMSTPREVATNMVDVLSLLKKHFTVKQYSGCYIENETKISY